MSDSERLRAIHARVLTKLKEVVREFAVTQDELHLAADYFNRLGQSGMFRSLIDVSLAMTSLDATVRSSGGTRPNIEGPFRGARPFRPDGNLLDHDPKPDEPQLTITGEIRDVVTGRPIPHARLAVWQADHHGHYDNVGDSLRGVILADDDGRYVIRTVVPKDYSDHDHDPIGELYRAMGRHNRRAAHIHVTVSAEGRDLLTTQLFIPGSDYWHDDYLEDAVSEDLTLDMTPDPTAPPGVTAYLAPFQFAVATTAPGAEPSK